jgi:hypothetical protein
MTLSRDPETAAFRNLRSLLSRRRLAQIDLRLRLELLLLGLLLMGFIFWQARLPFANLRAQGGAPLVLAALGITWLAMALVAAGFVAFRHAARLRAGPPGPAWLSLPITPPTLARHLAWDSSVMAGWLVFPAIGIWSAAVGLVPLAALAALTPLLTAVLFVATMMGAWLGQQFAVVGARGKPGLPPIHQVLTGFAHRSRRRLLAGATWVRRSASLTLVLKDLRLTGRVPDLRRQLAISLMCVALSVAAWGLPPPSSGRPLDYAMAFFMALLGSAAYGEWLVRLSGSDPFAVVRSLPVGLRHVWGARLGLALLGTAALIASQSLAARDLSPASLRVFLVWIGGATLAITGLAVNYGVTLFPRTDVAQRLFGLSLGLAVVASLMIPLLGWLVLLSAVFHSARRLPRWSRLEEA